MAENLTTSVSVKFFCSVSAAANNKTLSTALKALLWTRPREGHLWGTQTRFLFVPFHIFCCATYKAPQTRGEPEAVKFKLEGLSGAKKLQLFMMQRLALFRCVVTLCYSKKFQVTILARQPCVCGAGGCLLCVVFCFVLFFLPPQEASVSELPLRRWKEKPLKRLMGLNFRLSFLYCLKGDL